MANINPSDFMHPEVVLDDAFNIAYDGIKTIKISSEGKLIQKNDNFISKIVFQPSYCS